MKIISYRHEAFPGVGVVADDGNIISLKVAAPELPDTLRDILKFDPELKFVTNVVQGRSADLQMDEVTFDPVVPKPHATWALALNYTLHIEETGLTTSREYPQIFMRMPISQVGHNEPLWAPPLSVAEAYDYEGELAVVIGKPGRHIKREDAFDHIAGYSCYNEGSVREYQSQNRQFGLGKNFERSGSFGPWLVTKDEFGDPAGHTLITRLNGIERQKAEISGMLFDVPHLVSYLSEGYTLQPGDVIVTGSPGALPLRPGETPENPRGPVIVEGQLHMRHGDICEVEIDGIGVLSNSVITDPTPK
ncbi:MAG: fumarylacetoacetate hydrolase family protein [Pseudomonadota bacterium]|nr:fumarylacetoacetate hydrolase family protein [Pseudomonadota bacterium]